jgi:hypothetical protein
MRSMSAPPFSREPECDGGGAGARIVLNLESLGGGRMEYDREKVDEMVLALLWLTLAGDGRAWKGHDWDALERLHERGYISDPKSKAKSVVLSEAGERRARELFARHFGAVEK